MISQDVHRKYVITVGIETHVQLKTKTKLFAAIDNDARSAPPNSLVSHICFGLPGALPVLNEAAVHLAIRAAFALDTKPQSFSKFDRKHYFYPDLPKGYQITQYDEPIIIGGQIGIELPSGEIRVIHLTRAHMEEDAGKSTHPAGKNYSLIDLNRAGTPLLEIVSEPEMHSAIEAKLYARELYLRMKYAGVSDANLFYGNMRFDVNVSVSKNKSLGTRTETKNINSFRAVEKVVDFEVNRQVELLEKGHRIIQETRGWNEDKQKTYSQRSKENAEDYRYFPDPDIPPVEISQKLIEQIQAQMPIMPHAWRHKLSQLGLDKSHIETILEAEIEIDEISYLPLLETHLNKPKMAAALANWFVNVEIPARRSGLINAISTINQRNLVYNSVFQLVDQGKLSSTAAKALLKLLLNTKKLPEDIAEYAKKVGLIQLSDESTLIKIINDVINSNPQAVSDFKNGQQKVLGFLVGQTMQITKGQANPQLVHKLLMEQIQALSNKT